MRKLLLILLIMLPFAATFADGYSHLTFVCGSGSKQIAVSNLKITMSNNVLNASNGQETLSMPLADIQSMYFSGTDTVVSGIESVTLADDVPTVVYTVSGLQIGQYPSLHEAVVTLPAGVYVLQQGTVGKQIMIQ